MSAIFQLMLHGRKLTMVLPVKGILQSKLMVL